MEATIVYAFEYFDPELDRWTRAPVPATREAILRNGWREVPGSGRQVFRDQVSFGGVGYRPG